MQDVICVMLAMWHCCVVLYAFVVFVSSSVATFRPFLSALQGFGLCAYVGFQLTQTDTLPGMHTMRSLGITIAARLLHIPVMGTLYSTWYCTLLYLQMRQTSWVMH